MPKAARTSISSARLDPYSRTSPKSSSNSSNKRVSSGSSHGYDDKENATPRSSIDKSSKHYKRETPAARDVDWRLIAVEHRHGEVPLYDNATTVRRKLQKLLTSKSSDPGNEKKKWAQTTMVEELKRLEMMMGPVRDAGRKGAELNTKQLGKFLKQSGQLGGGDSPVYYWGYVMLEKMRIWNGEAKTKSRKEAEQKIPNGHIRLDPNTAKFWSGPGCPPPTLQELINAERDGHF